MQGELPIPNRLTARSTKETMNEQQDAIGLRSPSGEESQRSGSSASTSPIESSALDSTSAEASASGNALNSSIISTLDLRDEPEASLRTSDASGSTFQHTSEERTNVPDAVSGVSTPLAPQDVLAPVVHENSDDRRSSSLAVPPSFSSSSLAGDSSFGGGEGDLSGISQGGVGGAAATADDSALNALMEAHSREQLDTDQADDGSPQRPNRRDASFGLDPDVDTEHSVRSHPLAAHIFSSPSRSGHHRHTSDEKTHHHNVAEFVEEHAPSHTTASTGAPETVKSGIANTQTVPTVSATGMPRFLPRRSSSRSRSREKRRGREKHRPSYVDSDDEDDASSRFSATSEDPPPKELQPKYAPSGSLTLALFSSGITWRRRSYLLLASLAINVGLPFINGVMLGFGEIFARSVIAPWIGLAPAAININAPAAARSRGPPSSSTSGVGIRHAGKAADDHHRVR